jgi:hypothetical protein
VLGDRGDGRRQGVLGACDWVGGFVMDVLPSPCVLGIPVRLSLFDIDGDLCILTCTSFSPLSQGRSCNKLWVIMRVS